MKALMAVVILLSVSSATYAGTIFKCEPLSKDGYFTEDTMVDVLNAKSIKINNEVLTLDNTYKPRISTNSKRYIGKTAAAAQWADSGLVEIFFDGSKFLRFTVRGEMFISESFICSKI